MGQMRFIVDPPERLTPQRADYAYLSGIDRVPWPTRASIEPGDGGASARLVLERPVDESGSLSLPWPVEGFGELALTTGSLRERPQPYLLPLELARGTVGGVRDQRAEWEAVGLAVPGQARDQLAQALDKLAWAVVEQDNPPRCASLADAAIVLAMEAGRLLTGAYVEQSMTLRRRSGDRRPSLLGVDLGDTLLDEQVGTQVLHGFNAANVPLRWRAIEATEGTRRFAVPDRQLQWCQVHGLTCFAGPLLRFDADGVPDWLTLWQDDFENVASCAGEFIEAVVTRYRGRVHVWRCAGRVNTGNALDLSEREQLKLTAHAVELVAQCDPDRPRLICFDQPWAEEMSRRGADLPPLHIADALLGAGLEISGIGLEINVALSAAGSLPRTPMELSRRLDLWSGLGLPLYLFVSFPSGSGPDDKARHRADAPLQPWTTRRQQVWVARHVTLMLAKPYVAGVFWNQLLDARPHAFPHAGLFDQRHRAKPALRTLTAIRRTYLK